MNEKTKVVYYCDHCKRHGLSRSAMEKHEARCTLNPERVCRWCGNSASGNGPARAYNLRDLAEKVRGRAPLDAEAIAWVHDEVDGCPPCMLAVLRQSGVEYHYGPDGRNMWDYTEEVERYRTAEREDAAYNEYVDLTA